MLMYKRGVNILKHDMTHELFFYPQEFRFIQPSI